MQSVWSMHRLDKALGGSDNSDDDLQEEPLSDERIAEVR
jgi:hypothetical protein